MDPIAHEFTIEASGAVLHGDLVIPASAKGIVVFAHGSGSSRFSTRNQQVGRYLNREGFATLLFDLLTEAEDRVDRVTREFRFDIPLLGERLVETVRAVRSNRETDELLVGCFGASTGAAAALAAAAALPEDVSAVVSRGGRPDLADDALPKVTAPTLLIVGSLDTQVIDLNRAALAAMNTEAVMTIVPGASHLFEEVGTLEEVARLTAEWFHRTLVR